MDLKQEWALSRRRAQDRAEKLVTEMRARGIDCEIVPSAGPEIVIGIMVEPQEDSEPLPPNLDFSAAFVDDVLSAFRQKHPTFFR